MIILILIALFSLMITLTSFLIVDEYRSDLSYHEEKYQLEDFDHAFSHGEYYTMYKMALENEVKEGPLYADVSEYEYFGYFYYYLTEYYKAATLNLDTSTLEAKVLFYNQVMTMNQLLDRAEELKVAYNFKN